MSLAIRSFLGLACFLAVQAAIMTASVHAQYPPPAYPAYPGYPGYYPPPGYGGFGPGNTLNGAANVISASGQLFINQEQARVEREKANQAKILTKRQTFDEMMYEKANTPTFTENQEKTEMMIVRRVMNNPLPAEVTSGQSQNILLPYLDKLLRVGVQGPPISLDPTMLKSINVTTGKGGANIGILRDGGKLDWPFALRGATQKKLTPLFPKLVSSAMAGDVDFDLYTQASKGVSQLQGELKQRFFKDEIDASSYLEGKHFLDSLESSMKMIRSPSAAKFLNGTYAATGRTVPELVYNMTAKGLRFAPATPGNDAPYYALQSALVSFAAGAESNNGFRATFDPLVQAPKKSFANIPPP
jgi:hypothetical protein